MGFWSQLQVWARNDEGSAIHRTPGPLHLSHTRGGVCVVPFAGSGTECLAAARYGLHYIGYEINPRYVDIARKRLEIIDMRIL